MRTLLFLCNAILSLIVFFQTTDSYAQKIYLLAFYDKSDVSQRDIFSNDVERIKQTFRRQGANSAAIYNDEPGYFSFDEDEQEAAEWKGVDVYSRSFDNVFDAAINVLRDCPAGSNDALVVFWSGHGFFKNEEHFLAQSNGAELSRKTLLAEAKKVGARLTVLLTDSCARIKSQSANTNFQFNPFEPAPDVTPLFRELFFNYKGTVNVNAASVGEKAYSCVVKSKYPAWAVDGGCFSLALASSQVGGYPVYPGIGKLPVVSRAFQKATQPFSETVPFGAFDVFDYQTPSWDEFLEYVGETTDYIYRNIPFGTSNPRASQPGQTIWIVEKPTRISGAFKRQGGGSPDSLVWSSSFTTHPENGDRVVEINGQTVRNAADVYAKVAASPSKIVLKLVDHRSKRVFYLRTTLYPSSYSSRLGLYIKDAPQGGAIVTGCASGYPINKCQYAWE